jgi:hypothetical protein
LKKTFLFVLMSAATLAWTVGPAAAAENKQNTKMTQCQSQATEKKLEGKDRQAFVNDCLKAKPEKTAEKPKSKMAECNAKTKGMSKDDANKARAECMKG